MAYRPERLAELLKKEVSELLTQMKDPRIGFVTVTRVEVTGDLRQAKVYVSIMDKSIEKEDTVKALKKAQGFVRSAIGRQIRLRHIPEIYFIPDDSIGEGIRLIQLIDKVGKDNSANDDQK